MRQYPTIPLDDLAPWIDRTPYTTCWGWRGRHNPDGYALVGKAGYVVHRLTYAAVRGPIPEGCELDHLCRIRGCVNPAHLEPVSGVENVLRGRGHPALNKRKTHCKRGHPFDKTNTHVDSQGARQCIICTRKRRREWAREHYTSPKAIRAC